MFHVSSCLAKWTFILCPLRKSKKKSPTYSINTFMISIIVSGVKLTMWRLSLREIRPLRTFDFGKIMFCK